MKYLISILLCLFVLSIFSQEENTLIIQPIENNGNQFNFTSIDSPLVRIAGAPEPFYTFWWEFGDGHYSTEDNPVHHYNEKGTYTILLATTNNYNDGKGRKKRKRTININEEVFASVDNLPYIGKNEILRIEKNHSPKPEEEIVFVQTYKNLSSETQKGTLLFFYNEKAFENKHFVLDEYRTHYNEKSFEANKSDILKSIEKLDEEQSFSFLKNNNENVILASLNNEIKAYLFENNSKEESKEESNDLKYFNNEKQLKKEISLAYETYSDVIAWKFEDLKTQEERNVFLSFTSTSEMLSDTNVSISVQSIFIPNNISYSTRAKEVMPIVTAHDPNKLIVNKNKTFRSFSKKNPLEYEIKFQNVGKGPAEEVKLRFYNNADIDIKNLTILDFEPKCDFCNENSTGSCFDTTVTKEYVEFFFHNVYLPGTRQSDNENRKASKGSVKFSINTEKKIKQEDLTCRTEIYFDKEDPIRTNNAKIKFQKRLYFGLEIGANYLPISYPRADVFLRATSTYRITNNWYYRSELGVKYIPEAEIDNFKFTDTTFQTKTFGYDTIDVFGMQHISEIEDSISKRYISKTAETQTIIKSQKIQLDFVALEFRRDITSFLSLGFGLTSSINIVSFNKTEIINDVKVYNAEFEEHFALNLIDTTLFFVVDFSVEDPILSIDNDESYKNSSFSSSKTYNLDFSSGLFLDLNFGKIYKIPYGGIRAKLDYNFTNYRISPALQFYVGANF